MPAGLGARRDGAQRHRRSSFSSPLSTIGRSSGDACEMDGARETGNGSETSAGEVSYARE
jgi:hypothetical protein